MKKIIALLLAITICLSLCGCGKSKAATECENLINAIGEVSIESKEAIEAAEKAYAALTSDEKDAISASAAILADARSAYIFELSKDAYHNIESAYDIIIDFALDYYEVWRAGIFESDKIKTGGVKFLATYLRNISEDDLRNGIIRDAAKRRDAGGKGMTDEIVNSPDMYLSRCKTENLWSICPYSVIYAYEIIGRKDEAESFLNDAKLQMKELSEKYSDYEHYPNLKGLFSTVNSYMDTCFYPKHSFNQFAELKKEYEKEASDYIADLDFIFAE